MSPILEVVIGLFFIFSLLSILVTQVNALVAQYLRLRSNYLYGVVKNMLSDPEVIARFVTHPLIEMIDFKDVPGMENWEHLLPNQKLTPEQAEQILEGALSGVEWIEDNTFANVLLSIISVHEDRQLFVVLEDIAAQMEDSPERRDLRKKIKQVVDTGNGIDQLIDTINALPKSSHKKALVERLRDISNQIGDKGMKTDINVSLMAGVQYIKDQYLKNAINTILTTSKNLEEAEKKIKNWFNNTNYKATEFLQRDMRRSSYLIGFLIAVIINVDTMYISLTLWNDPVLRSTLAETAATVDISELEQMNQTATDAIASVEPVTEDDVTASAVVVGDTFRMIQDTRIPMGWNFSNLEEIYSTNPSDPRLTDSRYLWNLWPGNNPEHFPWLISLKIVGLLATTLAVGQGAPFWFNLLKQLR